MLLAGPSKSEDFTTVVRVGDTETGIKISRPWSGPSNLSFTVCDPESAQRIKAANMKPAHRELAAAARQ